MTTPTPDSAYPHDSPSPDEVPGTEPLSPALFVVVWRDSSATSARLSTYVSDDDTPLAYPLSDISPTPPLVVTTPEAFHAWLSSPTSGAVALAVNVARSELGWEPAV